MMKRKHFDTRFAGFAVAAALLAASAFADVRPPQKTVRGAEAGRTDSRIVAREAPGSTVRDRKDEKRGRSEWKDEKRGENQRNGRHGSHASAHGKRAPYHAHGRVTKVRPWSNGYRVWVVGAPHPFYVPVTYWNPDRFRVGVTIQLGGTWNPAGWYDYDCIGCDDFAIRGVVTGIDYRRDLLDLRTRDGSHVTVILPPRGEHIRRGDDVLVFGDWTRRGLFVANDVDVLGRYRR